MRGILRRWNLPAGCVLATILVLPGGASALDTAFTYQGHLEQNGAPATGSFDFEFELWNDLGSGQQVGPTVTLLGLQVTEGYFDAELDFGSSPYDGNRLWLQVSVRPAASGIWTELSPRKELTPAPYSLHSADAGSLGGLAAGSFMTVPEYDADTNSAVDLAEFATSAGDADTVDGFDAQELMGAEVANTELSLIGFMNLQASGNLTIPPPGYVSDFLNSDLATTSLNLVHDSGTYETIDYSSPSLYLVVIRASEVDEGALEINECEVVQLSSDKWVLYSDFDDTKAKNRSRVLYTLFMDVRTGIRGVTSPLSLASNEATDTGLYAVGLRYKASLCCFGGTATRTYDMSGVSGEFEVLYRIHGSANVGNPNQMAATSSYESPLNVARRVVDDDSGPSTVTVLGSEPDVLLDAANWDVIFRLYVSTSLNRTWSGDNSLVLLLDQLPTLDLTDVGGTIDFLNSWENPFGIPLSFYDPADLLSSTLVTEGRALSSSPSEVFLLIEDSVGGSAVVSYEVSFDAGANWSPVAEQSWSSVAPSGAEMRIRATITRSAPGESVVIDYYGGLTR